MNKYCNRCESYLHTTEEHDNTHLHLKKVDFLKGIQDWLLVNHPDAPRRQPNLGEHSELTQQLIDAEAEAPAEIARGRK